MVKMITMRVYMYFIITESEKKIKAFAIVNYGLINQIKRHEN